VEGLGRSQPRGNGVSILGGPQVVATCGVARRCHLGPMQGLILKRVHPPAGARGFVMGASVPPVGTIAREFSGP
jgi:hypothetical protein